MIFFSIKYDFFWTRTDEDRTLFQSFGQKSDTKTTNSDFFCIDNALGIVYTQKKTLDSSYFPYV